jgi:hypothetical protein
MVKALLAEAQFDQELAKAFLKHWLLPRREAATTALQDAIQSGQLRSDLSIPETLDVPYGGLYYRLMTGSGAISAAYVETVCSGAARLATSQFRYTLTSETEGTQKKMMMKQ